MMASPFTFYRGAAKIMAADLQGHPDRRAERAAVRRRPPVELRRVRLPGADAAVRPQRLRRDPSRAVRVRRQAHGRELHDRRLATTGSARPTTTPRRCVGARRTARRWPTSPDARPWTSGTPDCPRGVMAAIRAPSTSRADKGRGGQEAQKPPRRTPGRPTPETACRRCPSWPRWSTVVPDRQPTPSSCRCVTRSRVRDSADELEDIDPRAVPRLPCTLQDDRRHLLERFEVVDMARKVVGSAASGTRAFIVLLQGRDDEDPLFLQVKEATTSVLEDHLPKSRYASPGERVVQGQRMMQAASDIFLGWTKGVEADRYLYWRQLRDMKGSAVVETMTPPALKFYARLRLDPGAGSCPLRRPGRDRRVPGQEGRLRPGHHRLLRTLRRPERTGLRRVHRGDRGRPASRPRRRLTRTRPDDGGPEMGLIEYHQGQKFPGVAGRTADESSPAWLGRRRAPQRTRPTCCSSCSTTPASASWAVTAARSRRRTSTRSPPTGCATTTCTRRRCARRAGRAS